MMSGQSGSLRAICAGVMGEEWAAWMYRARARAQEGGAGMNGNYKVEIGVDIEGRTGIGADWIRSHEIADSEKVYGSQIGHRAAVHTPTGWQIMTPTEAADREAVRFPGPRR